MKYYSEILNKKFDTIGQLEAEEAAEKAKLLKQVKEEKERDAAIEKAKQELDIEREQYNKLKEELNKQFHSYIKARDKYDKLKNNQPDRYDSLFEELIRAFNMSKFFN